jgi:hypothetical protein
MREGVIVQTDQELNPDLHHKVRKSKKSFSNQVYLKQSEDELRSRMAPTEVAI